MATTKPPHVVIPIGTKVLTRLDRRVGLVVHVPLTPAHGYQVRFADGGEESFRRDELSIFKHADAEIPGAPAPDALRRYVIFRSIIGSTAYGLNHAGSDVARAG